MPGLISDELINNLRNVAYKQLVTEVKIHRLVYSEGPYGSAETDQVVATVMTWFKPDYKGSLRVQSGGQIGHASDAEFRFAVGTDVQVGDRLEVNGETDFIVQDVNTGATIQLYLKATAKRLE